MKRNHRLNKTVAGLSLIVASALLVVLLATGVFAEDVAPAKAVNEAVASYEIEDANPAIYVTQKNANSVVGVIADTEVWNRRTRETSMQVYSEGSGVVIAEGGYILTNHHVVSGGDSYRILMPSGEKVEATLVGQDSSYDLAVLKVDEAAAAQLTPAAIGSVERLSVGSTVVAIGNPGGETLYNTVTSGIVSSLAREVNGSNTSRSVAYIQHDAAINSGNSGGGLFDVNGNLIGINTLKYSGSAFYGSTFEGLGFAIPVDAAYPIAVELIEKGKVERAGLGVGIVEVTGADEATDNEPPTGLYVRTLLEDGPAERAGVQVGDYIIAINGKRVTTAKELTSEVDQHKAGDTVTLTIVRYTAADDADSGYTKTSGSRNPFDGYFNDYFNDRRPTQTYKAETLEIEVTLEILN